MSFSRTFPRVALLETPTPTTTHLPLRPSLLHRITTGTMSRGDAQQPQLHPMASLELSSYNTTSMTESRIASDICKCTVDKVSRAWKRRQFVGIQASRNSKEGEKVSKVPKAGTARWQSYKFPIRGYITILWTKEETRTRIGLGSIVGWTIVGRVILWNAME
ncbi:uncharacterized protein MELLADRAFT_108335 [Melampsora larici-populina 98AG31]|uniref:Uncharacterized protein n=1 Tax=Melampsora larici-populina (strain 98AG31 / pathotype 3-4-7) TaxID=747676 RepID=F4RSS3_MELLP|nr:uncharacterized protein MELLADRAFT_108335 [Melampsora larici-populina 98AG31]EGG04558.1 hypothetical protein MELLADRAFT_108335 [Melampsora larici-populina 98AG31]